MVPCLAGYGDINELIQPYTSSFSSKIAGALRQHCDAFAAIYIHDVHCLAHQYRKKPGFCTRFHQRLAGSLGLVLVDRFPHLDIGLAPGAQAHVLVGGYGLSGGLRLG